MPDVKIKGKVILVDGVRIGEIQGWRDPSGKTHTGYHIKVDGHGTIGHWVNRNGYPEKGWIPAGLGCYAYAADAQKAARDLFKDGSWKGELDHVVRAALKKRDAEAAKAAAEAPKPDGQAADPEPAEDPGYGMRM